MLPLVLCNGSGYAAKVGQIVLEPVPCADKSLVLQLLGGAAS
jgi:hypothetical protein